MSPPNAAAPAPVKGEGSEKVTGEATDSSISSASNSSIVGALDRVVAELAAQRVELARIAESVDYVVRGTGSVTVRVAS